MVQKNMIASLRSFIEAYESYCKPICRELGMPQMAFDILMFLANNPEFFTAKDICRMRGFKENIVSVNVNKLVSDGYLIRKPVEGDRRKVRLRCTEKAWPIVERGLNAQSSFSQAIRKNILPEDMLVFEKCMEIMLENAAELSGRPAGSAVPEIIGEERHA